MPFAKTALVNSSGAARPKSGGGEFINHFAGVRLRVVGSGELEMTLRGPDNVETQTLGIFTLAATNRISPYRVASFMQERAQLEVSTDTIDETFRINRIIFYVKPVFTMEPG